MPVTVIKVSGKLLDGEMPESFAYGLKRYLDRHTGRRVCIVHGGGTVLDHWMGERGITVRKINGLRCTPAEQMPLVSGALAGFCNTRLTGALLKNALPAAGLTLADGFITRVIPDPDVRKVYGQVAEVRLRSDALPAVLCAHGFIPVICSLAFCPEQGWFNVNADRAAIALATMENADQLWFLSDVAGVLNAQGEVIPHLQANENEETLPSFITGGMRVKTLAAMEAARICKCAVRITGGTDRSSVHRLFEEPDYGTCVDR